MPENNKPPWVTVLGVILSIGTPLFLWGWSIEKRMARLENSYNVTERVQRLEEALMPVLIEYKLQAELKKFKMPANAAPNDLEEEIRKDSEDWARNALQMPPTPEKR